MEIDELFGLPAHPLIVHAALALVPLAAVLTVVAAVWPAGRRCIGWVAVVVAAVAVVSIKLAQGSGEQLQHQVQETDLVEEHAEMGDEMLLPAIGLLVGAVIVTLAGRSGDRRPQPEPGTGSTAVATGVRGAGAVSVVVGVVALATSGWAVYELARVGHSGAKAVWDETGKGGQERSGGEDSLGIPGAQLPQR
jgi:hypothetical protein